MFHNYESEKITRKASDAAENLQLYQVVWFFHPRSSCTTHLMLFSERPPIYASCMTISGGRTEFHWKFVMAVAPKNTKVIPLLESLTICAFILIQYQSVMDTRTDRRMDLHNNITILCSAYIGIENGCLTSTFQGYSRSSELT